MGNDNQSNSSSTAERVADYASEASERVGKFAHDAGKAAQGAAQDIADKGRDAGERVQEVAGNFRGAVDKSVREKPMATLAMAAVLGFVLGAIWKS
jgi:ElaB/YqjD/DUF883 family membrane-anchored ribosome-binding protein